MEIIENSKTKETLYYVIWGTKYGSNDSKFIVPGEEVETEVPKGVAHFLEHKMFEQESGINSLDTLTALGVEANAYTTNDHTAYLFECTENFYPALDELMNYVQNPYFTDENVEKEKGIIGQEIMMYDDYPEWKVYLNALEAMYHEHPVKLDITGTIETINNINKEILYKCYNTFYNPSNMVMVLCGDFEPQELLKEIKKRIIKNDSKGEIKRIYPTEPENIVKNIIEQKMDVSQPLFVIGIKDKLAEENELVKKHIAIEILLNIIIGKSSKLYEDLYKKSMLFAVPSLDYEFATGYAHILITGQSKKPEEVFKSFKSEITLLKKNGLELEEFERIKKKIYGGYIREYNDVTDIARMFLADNFKGINSFEYIDVIMCIDKEYVEQILKEVFIDDKMIISVIKKD